MADGLITDHLMKGAAPPDGAFVPTDRTAVRRHRERGQYDRDLVYGILDEGFICHAACQLQGTVWMIPTAYGRAGDRLLLHGAAANHVLKAASAGAELTVTVTLVDGLVLARSTFHHSINYRSVVVFGRATPIEEPAAKADALARIVDHILPGRSADARGPNSAELASTRVVWLPLDEVSAKVRTGGPIEDEEDMALPVWAGVLPLRPTAGPPQSDQAGAAGVAGPAYLSQPGRWKDGS
jgi:nitroimidazol reductase NimA-like FMN-containing flavoprotein (pyridoxamine 5'-phosphate oxidase superfamily)